MRPTALSAPPFSSPPACSAAATCSASTRPRRSPPPAKPTAGRSAAPAAMPAGRSRTATRSTRRPTAPSVFAGWRDMNDYMRENKIEPVAPQLAAQAGQAQPARRPRQPPPPPSPRPTDDLSLSRLPQRAGVRVLQRHTTTPRHPEGKPFALAHCRWLSGRARAEASMRLERGCVRTALASPQAATSCCWDGDRLDQLSAQSTLKVAAVGANRIAIDVVDHERHASGRWRSTAPSREQPRAQPSRFSGPGPRRRTSQPAVQPRLPRQDLRRSRCSASWTGARRTTRRSSSGPSVRTSVRRRRTRPRRRRADRGDDRSRQHAARRPVVLHSPSGERRLRAPVRRRSLADRLDPAPPSARRVLERGLEHGLSRRRSGPTRAPRRWACRQSVRPAVDRSTRTRSVRGLQASSRTSGEPTAAASCA